MELMNVSWITPLTWSMIGIWKTTSFTTIEEPRWVIISELSLPLFKNEFSFETIPYGNVFSHTGYSVTHFHVCKQEVTREWPIAFNFSP